MTAVGTGRRSLLDIAVAACGEPGNGDGRHHLLATDAAALATLGPLRIVTHAVASGGLDRGARRALPAGDIQTLLLARLSAAGAVDAVWVIDGWSLLRARGERADLRGARLRGAQLCGARLSNADLTDADLTGADLEKADLSGATLTGANLAGSNLFSASLQNADLTEAELCRADLRHVDLRESTCLRTAFRGADFWGAYLWHVDLSAAFTAGADTGRSDHLDTKVPQ
jgi:uncharacterized protein YjbI with pentapeptide repeats